MHMFTKDWFPIIVHLEHWVYCPTPANFDRRHIWLSDVTWEPVTAACPETISDFGQTLGL